MLIELNRISLDIPTYGEYWLEGENVSNIPPRRLSAIRNRNIGFIFQGFNLIPALTALENVELPLIYRGMSAGQRRQLSLDALEEVGPALRRPAAESCHCSGHRRPTAGHHGGRAYRKSGYPRRR